MVNSAEEMKAIDTWIDEPGALQGRGQRADSV